MHTITGHHHISMITKNAAVTQRFYQTVLGLRRVKKTVNQDDPSMYHLFYGDLTGSPGTELSFFEMPIAGRTVRGTNAITRIGLLVPSAESLLYWQDRFDHFGVQHEGIGMYAGREAIRFEDSEGLRLVLVNNNGENVPEFWAAWEESPVETAHRILGMGPVEVTVRTMDKTAKTLRELFGYTEIPHPGEEEEEEEEARFQAVPGQSFGEVILRQQEGPREKPGRGSIHHLAVRVKDETELRHWENIVKQRGFVSTRVIDRYYFHSLYFRDANGILFEIATDGPGFTRDSAIGELGKALDLPAFLEEKRDEIEAKLQPID